MIKTLKIYVLGVIIVGMSAGVSAVPISGQIGFGSTFTPVDSSGSLTTLDAATGIDFAGDAAVLFANGDFTGADSTATTTDFQFEPLLASIPDFWTVGVGADTYSFELTSVARDACGASYLCLSGEGIITSSDLTKDATVGTWMFSGNEAGTSFGLNDSLFVWSAGSEAVAAVPEPATLALLGMGLLFGAGSRHLRRGSRV